MSNYLPHEIDPETLRVAVDVPFMDHLKNLMDKAMDLSRRGKVVSIYHQHDPAYTNEAGEEVAAADHIGYRDYEPDFFNKGYFLCPRDADAEFEVQNKSSRPFPSIIIEDGKPIVSKPGLCDQCEHRLHRATKGNCQGLRFKALAKVAV